MRTKLLFIFCALCTMSVFAQVPVPVIGLDFEDQIDDQMESVTTGGANYEFDTDDERGGTVILFNGDGTGDAIGNGTNTTGTYVDVTPEAYSFDEVSINLWFNCNVVETWSRIFTFGTFGDGHNTKPEVWLSPANGRKGGELAFSAGMSDAGLTEISAGVIEAEKWYMVTVTHNADVIQLYLDGEFKAEGAVTFSPSDLYNSEFGFGFGYLGVAPWPDAILDGKMDNFTVYNKILSDVEILALFECTVDCIKPTTSIDGIAASYQPKLHSSNGNIYIKNVDNIDINAVQIYDMVGKLVFQTNEFNEVISPNLPSNIYIVKIQSNKGNFAKQLSIQ